MHNRTGYVMVSLVSVLVGIGIGISYGPTIASADKMTCEDKLADCDKFVHGMFDAMVVMQDLRLKNLDKFLVEAECEDLFKEPVSVYTAIYFRYAGLQEYLDMADAKVGFVTADVKRLDGALAKRQERMLDRMQKCADDAGKKKR